MSGFVSDYQHARGLGADEDGALVTGGMEPGTTRANLGWTGTIFLFGLGAAAVYTLGLAAREVWSMPASPSTDITT